MDQSEIEALDQAFAGSPESTLETRACRICDHPLRAWIDSRLRLGTGPNPIVIFLRSRGYKATEERVKFHRRQGHHLATIETPA